MAPVLNLNNEVVKMRKDVKKARVLTIRRLTRHIGKLKLKKGSEDLKLKNQKRVERLIEEIHAMKEIKPDQVTRLALRKEVNFESVCRKPKSTASERAIARLATHPLLKPKIAELKAAVKAFKDARQNPAKANPSEKKSEVQPKSAQNSNSNLNGQVLKLVQKQQGFGDRTKPSVKMETVGGADKVSEGEPEQEIMEMERIPKEFSPQSIEMQAVTQTGKKLGCKKRKENVSMNKLTAVKQIVRDDSDLEQQSEEEYFDDSTEERFYNQTSNSDSDSNDDFFIGKVKRKKKTAAASDLFSVEEKNTLQKNIPKEEKSTVSGTVQNLVMEGKPHGKARKLESVFCTSLSTCNQKSQNRRNTKDQPLTNRQTALHKKEPQLKKQSFAKASILKRDGKNPRLEQPLHPSWEASRRRREQMSQITAFQGKKIKFDD
ncbi:serum response factor-binding protein 1 isoform X2 [Gallus gallus]|uniref:Serum response factor-binding protein 1 n=1 Tax=Gallus gallus TaxID=9031 RepID=E1C0L6_CHICK|nr:serum response factor-binding protein 1 isoform X2 [Gallus gallus]XP_424408.2 serum response factor-binding protein 1 isoform X2 [Gallus gallus]|eukprot:XP_424408.2 serum response factor-binding protein 1 [Gallus gallus]